MPILSFPIVLTMLLVFPQFLVPMAIAPTGEGQAASALVVAENMVVLGYQAVSEAADSGANVSSLLVQLNEAGWLLACARIAYKSGDFDSALDFAAQSQDKLKSSDYTYVYVRVTGTGNARILLRFFLDDGTGFDVVSWGSPAALNATAFDLSPFAGRTLTTVCVALMSSDGTPSNINITQIALTNQALPSSVPLSGWQKDPQYTNASYVLTSTPSSLYVQLDATNTNSKVTIFNPNTPKLNGIVVEANALKESAIQVHYLDFMINVVGSIVGSVAVVCGGVVVWVLLKRKYEKTGSMV